MHTLTERQINALQAGQRVTVSTPDMYVVTGHWLGFTLDRDGPQISLRARDGLERRIPLAGATVTTDDD